MASPVMVVRLPRGPDGQSRGFDPTSPRYHALSPSSIQASNNCSGSSLEEEQRSRSVLRERFLRSLITMAGKPVNFTMYEKVDVTATFGASDIDILNFQVSHLQTPLGVQKEALLRCPDIIAYTFNL
ncbi:gem-associated protein 7 isoform X2 [Heptranchias perlo]